MDNDDIFLPTLDDNGNESVCLSARLLVDRLVDRFGLDRPVSQLVHYTADPMRDESPAFFLFSFNWFAYFAEMLRREFPTEEFPGHTTDEYYSELNENHFETVAALFAGALHARDKAPIVQSTGLNELFFESYVVAARKYPSSEVGSVPEDWLSAKVVGDIRRNGTQLLSERLGRGTQQGKPPKFRINERDSILMYALVEAEKAGSPRSQKWVAAHLGVSERTLRGWVFPAGWKLACEWLLDEAKEKGLLPADG
jgi:hypothetical protein